MSNKKINIAIIGATGYTGVELLKILCQHPHANIKIITSRNLTNKSLASVFPNFYGSSIASLVFTEPDISLLSSCDLVFFATPHGVAMNMAAELIKNSVRIIDLGADFRIKDSVLWQEYYNMKHTEKQLLKQAVYGLSEHYFDDIKNASLVANPGCYPTAIALSLKPLLTTNYINKKTIIADCKSGVSGAGRSANLNTSLCEVSESIKAYGIPKHRHFPEIEQLLSSIANSEVRLNFIPHLVPMIRGMLATIYVDLITDIDIATISNLFIDTYKNNSFIEVLPVGQMPETRFVKTSNNCQIGIQLVNNNKLVVVSVIDNLVKGASGQAVQNMNIMFGLNETLGLTGVALIP